MGHGKCEHDMWLMLRGNDEVVLDGEPFTVDAI